MESKSATQKNILVLGADGLVGNMVFAYLSRLPEYQVWGTSRTMKQKKIFPFTVENGSRNLLTIHKQLEHIDYVINCIAILGNAAPRKDMILVNALFPHLLEELAEQYHFKLIHISTDAVFPPLAGAVTESSSPLPTDTYGQTKLLGETTSKEALTIRSSFIGLDPVHHRGLIELILKEKTEFPGFANQRWTGCTSLQFAQFCTFLMKEKNFSHLRGYSPIFHFAPLGPLTKFALSKMIADEVNSNIKVIKESGEKRSRILETEYAELLKIHQYPSSVPEAIRNLRDFSTA